ncbi:MAG: (d)CMP kinase [Bdellovibrionota bacterium]
MQSNMQSNMQKRKVLAIDGLSATGKSTLAKTLAKKIGFVYLTTGILYRAVAYVVLKK